MRQRLAIVFPQSSGENQSINLEKIQTEVFHQSIFYANQRLRKIRRRRKKTSRRRSINSKQREIVLLPPFLRWKSPAIRREIPNSNLGGFDFRRSKRVIRKFDFEEGQHSCEFGLSESDSPMLPSRGKAATRSSDWFVSRLRSHHSKDDCDVATAMMNPNNLMIINVTGTIITVLLRLT